MKALIPEQYQEIPVRYKPRSRGGRHQAAEATHESGFRPSRANVWVCDKCGMRFEYHARGKHGLMACPEAKG